VNLSKLKLRLVLLISFTVVAVSATYLFIISFLWINSYGVSEASQILFLGIVVFIIFLVFTISSTVLTSVLRHVPDTKQIKSEAHQEKEEAGMDLVSMVAHELRTPLTSVKGYLAVFMEENKGKFDSTQNMFLHRINVAVQQLMGLTENLLSASRIEKGVFAISAQSIDWADNVAEVYDEFLERAKDKKINLDFVKPEHHTFFVKVDKVRIEEVLLNLLSNAISYTDANGKVTVSIEQKGQEVITHVKDTGVGIPKSAIPHLFTKFFRVGGKTSQGIKGTGLGLYISKAIVERHGGRIWVESEEGVGSTFSFSLPSASSS
jgi:signal transduction histidine kinase